MFLLNTTGEIDDCLHDGQDLEVSVHYAQDGEADYATQKNKLCVVQPCSSYNSLCKFDIKHQF